MNSDLEIQSKRLAKFYKKSGLLGRTRNRKTDPEGKIRRLEDYLAVIAEFDSPRALTQALDELLTMKDAPKTEKLHHCFKFMTVEGRNIRRSTSSVKPSARK